MYFLAFEQARTQDPAMALRQRRFWHNHLGRWIVPFAAKISESDLHPYYSKLAGLVLAFAALEKEFLSAQLVEYPSTGG